MIVIHPKDRTTDMLCALYEGTEHILIDQQWSNKQLCHILNHVPRNERIMLLGHGSDRGLFSRTDDSSGEFDRLMVSHSHAYYLRKHGGNIVAVWCNANLFAAAERLHGLFSGMIITEMSEAAQYGVATTQQELEVENCKIVMRLRMLLDEGIPFPDIPVRMEALDDARTPLTQFNYKNFYCL